jgi:hypothetical protein
VRLVGEHVEARALDVPSCKRLHERRLVDDRPRAMLISVPLLPSAASTLASIRLRVAGPPGHATTRKSDSTRACADPATYE